jgi:hypothetical protein
VLVPLLQFGLVPADGCECFFEFDYSDFLTNMTETCSVLEASCASVGAARRQWSREGHRTRHRHALGTATFSDLYQSSQRPRSLRGLPLLERGVADVDRVMLGIDPTYIRIDI